MTDQTLLTFENIIKSFQNFPMVLFWKRNQWIFLKSTYKNISGNSFFAWYIPGETFGWLVEDFISDIGFYIKSIYIVKFFTLSVFFAAGLDSNRQIKKSIVLKESDFLKNNGKTQSGIRFFGKNSAISSEVQCYRWN